MAHFSAAFRLPLVLFAVLLAPVAAQADAKIGVASAVKNQVEGRGARVLTVGSDVFANERIRTGDAATAQLLFLDKTVLSVGPKAEVLLDRFVYNPNRGAGQVVVNAVQGSMRFVTGAQNPTNYNIKTPVATLGIRGTVLDLQVMPLGVFVGVLDGAVTIQFPNGTSLTLTKGEYAILGPGGVQKRGPYTGSDPNVVEVADFIRLDEINQLSAIDARNYVPPRREENYNPCYPYPYCY